ncbi:unnamed protein product [Sphenostylis stenocarpa]|uniref:Uncharacterized protein n=1 Tax=Sphenostylis stenocarpa TaxID=92480 RepID=A0AA86SXC0_9FABA|nr:unnamed protein product [Sphenostylis stenocarpa]
MGMGLIGRVKDYSCVVWSTRELCWVNEERVMVERDDEGRVIMAPKADLQGADSWCKDQSDVDLHDNDIRIIRISAGATVSTSALVW